MFDGLWLYQKPLETSSNLLVRQKELDANSKAILQTEFVEQLKNIDGENADGTQSMFVLEILEKIWETRFKFSKTVL